MTVPTLAGTEQKAHFQLLWLQRNFNLSLDCTLTAWKKSSKSYKSHPDPGVWGRKGAGADEEGDLSLVFPVLGLAAESEDDFVVAY